MKKELHDKVFDAVTLLRKYEKLALKYNPLKKQYIKTNLINNMYIDKDDKSNYSIMELSEDEIILLKDLSYSFQYLIDRTTFSLDEKAEMAMFCAKLNFAIKDTLKE